MNFDLYSITRETVLDTPPDAVALAQRLITYNTVNPPGQEADCAEFLGGLLSQAGFQVERYAHAPGRTSLLARAGRKGAKRALCFVGHMDTVPLGQMPWSHDPFAAQIIDGKLYGRGACDMKSGVAAFVTAALRTLPDLPADSELVLLLVAGEETGCEGSLHLATLGLPLDHFTGVVVGEPTDNFPLLGHKGALWLQAAIKGIAAHGANPEAGVNAIRKGAEIVMRLDHFCSHVPAHPVLGKPTLNIGTFHGGQNINSVPDWVEVGLDIRTTPSMGHGEFQDKLKTMLAPHLHKLSVQTSMECVYTSLENPWVQDVFQAIKVETGLGPDERIANYFTDASALKPVFRDAPILILGPGRPSEMHQTDEYCEVAGIDQAVRIYERVIVQTLAAGTALAAAA